MNGLPKYHHKQDREFIKSSIKKLPSHWRGQVLDYYSDKYQTTYYNEPNEVHRENIARKAANMWLLGYVKKYQQRRLQKTQKQG